MGAATRTHGCGVKGGERKLFERGLRSGGYRRGSRRAKLHFGGVWLKSNEELSSNFCGEMTDRYQRQINFEAYEIGHSKICHAGSWTTGKQRVEAEATKKDRKRDIF